VVILTVFSNHTNLYEVNRLRISLPHRVRISKYEKLNLCIKKLKNIKHSPRHIIFYAISKYLDDNTYKSVLDQLGREFPKQDRKFLSILKQHFNLELIKDKPLIWQDI
jgi:hypothetical protein